MERGRLSRWRGSCPGGVRPARFLWLRRSARHVRGAMGCPGGRDGRNVQPCGPRSRPPRDRAAHSRANRRSVLGPDRGLAALGNDTVAAEIGKQLIADGGPQVRVLSGWGKWTRGCYFSGFLLTPDAPDFTFRQVVFVLDISRGRVGRGLGHEL